MKKNALIFALALLIALPIFGLAAEAATAPALEPQSAPTTALGGQYGRRWNQVPAQNDPQNGFVDADSDGLCDLCGNEQGKNTGAPNFVDSDLNGVCDHFGTELQGQGNARMQAASGFSRGMMAKGNAQQAGGRGNPQGQNYIDENNDGQCDIFAAGGQRNPGRGRNRR